MKPIKYIIATLAFLITGIQSQAQQTPCELDTSYAVPGGNYETLSERYMIETPPDTLFPDTIGDITIDTTEMELEDSTRHVVWIHGLGGDDNAWANMADAFNTGHQHPNLSRKIISKKVDYSNNEDASTTYSIGTAIYDHEIPIIINDNPNHDYDPERTILIAHSQGGIVARQMDRYKSSPDKGNIFGGFATFATPNQGAQIINNQGMVNAFLEDMADDLLEGPTENLVSSDRFFIRLIAKWADVAGLKDTIVQFFADDIGEYLISQNLPKTTADYAVPNAPIPRVDTAVLNYYIRQNQIENLNSYNTQSIGIVPFYSRANLLNVIEHEDILRTYEIREPIPGFSPEVIENTKEVTFDVPVGISLRTLNYFVVSPYEMHDFTAQDFFHDFAIKYHKTLLDYKAQRDRNAAILYDCDVCDAYSRLYRKRMKRARDRMRAWQKGVDYLISFDRRYRALTGILKSTAVLKSNYYCDCTEYTGDEEIEWTIGPLDEPIDCYEEEGPNIICNSREEQVLSNTYENLPSDGVVLEESAKEIPQRTHLPVEIKPDEEDEHLGGATHMELRNTSYTRDELENLFDGNYGLFFWTPKDK